jgi:hypothetical protein
MTSSPTGNRSSDVCALNVMLARWRRPLSGADSGVNVILRPWWRPLSGTDSGGGGLDSRMSPES